MISSYPMPANPGGNPFYNPAFGYWAIPGTNATQEHPFKRGMAENSWQFGEQNPEAPWTGYLAQLGFGGTDPKGTWARGLYGRAQEGYAAAQQKSTTLNWQDYLHSLNIPQMYAGLSPNQKGYNDQQFGGPARCQRCPSPTRDTRSTAGCVRRRRPACWSRDA